jgi:site-specific recombinase XerD
MALIDNRKNNKKRMIFWDEKTNQAIKDFIEFREENDIESEYLITSKVSSKISTRGVQYIVRRSKENAGIKEQLVPHSFRHGFAHRGVKANINLRKLQGMMGHQNLLSTQVYMPLADPSFRSEYDKIYESPKEFYEKKVENKKQESLFFKNGN